MVALCLGVTGCSLFGKKQPPQPTASPGDPLLSPRADRGNPAAGAERQASADAPVNPVVPTSAGNGVLAGQVIDSFGRPPAEAYVLVQCPKQGGDTEKKPIDVAANPQGYFTITGLKPGRHYQLTARARDGNHMLAGMTWATAPNPRVLIRISEDFVTRNTPPVPPPPSWPGAKEKERAAAAHLEQPRPADGNTPPKVVSADQGWGPIRVETPDPKREASDDHSSFDREPAAPAQPKLRPQDIVQDGRKALEKGPLINWQAGPSQAPNRGWSPQRVPPADKVPSCVLSGKILVNFALYDLDDKVWEFRNRTGRLVLLDFWGTWCVPCRQAIPHLKILQERYRAAGLQVVGIAYENGGTPAQQRTKVDELCQRLQINYKVLMGSRNCPVQTDFGVRSLPTMVLLDKNGWIIYSHEGLPTGDEWQELESKIQGWLGVR
jgi:thiol-disulfide isomerase/thioredoxin